MSKLQIVKCPFRKCTVFLTRRAVVRHFISTHGRLPTERESNALLIGTREYPAEDFRDCPDCGLKFFVSKLYQHVLFKHKRIPTFGEFPLPQDKERCLTGIVSILEEGEMPLYCSCLFPILGQRGCCRKCTKVVKPFPKMTAEGLSGKQPKKKQH